MTEAFTHALIAELAKKTGVCWLRYPDPEAPDAARTPRTRAAWHVWHDGALHLVAGGTEQQLPGLVDTDRVEVIMRSKDTGGRLLTWVGRASAVPPSDPSWEDAAAALVADRLNLDDLAAAKREWAEHSVVVRVDPTGEALEEPGALSDEDHAAPPPPTDATTRGPLPRVLHRRRRTRPDLT